MEQVTRRCVAAGAALAACGFVVATPAVKSTLPDVQVRDADLLADVSELNHSQVSAFYDLVQQELGGNADLDLAHHDVDPGAALFGGDGGTFNTIDTPALNADGIMLDQSLLGSLFGADSVAEILREGAINGVNPIGAGAVGGITPGGEFGSDAQGGDTAATNAAAAVANVIAAFPAAYQSFTEGVVAAEMALNSYLVSAQETAANQAFGAGSPNSDLVNFMFNLSNMALAHNEDSLNSLLGANFDPGAIQSSLLTNFDPEGLSQAQWAAALGLTPDDFTAIVAAVGSNDYLSLLGGLFPG